MIGALTWPRDERDASGLTDRAYLDVLGLCVSAAIVAWLLGSLAIAAEGFLGAAAAIAFFAAALFLAEWTGQLLRQTVVYADTWRYGGIS